MTTEKTWWEQIFEGNLSSGINKEAVNELENENFLYFKDQDV